MSELQWALLILSAIVVIAVIATSLRNRGGGRRAEATPHISSGAQLDILLREGQFDEFGVGRPRKRGGGDESEPEGDEPAAAIDGASLAEPARAPAPKPLAVAAQKIVSLLLVQPDGIAIAGTHIHEALEEQGLIFGERQIYHRLRDAEPVFSVAGLLKPGILDPAAAHSFSAPGLSIFLVLPGPVSPREALRDMIETSRTLASLLGAQLFDSRKKPLDRTALRNLADEVEDWARVNDA